MAKKKSKGGGGARGGARPKPSAPRAGYKASGKRYGEGGQVKKKTV